MKKTHIVIFLILLVIFFSFLCSYNKNNYKKLKLKGTIISTKYDNKDIRKQVKKEVIIINNKNKKLNSR